MLLSKSGCAGRHAHHSLAAGLFLSQKTGLDGLGDDGVYLPVRLGFRAPPGPPRRLSGRAVGRQAKPSPLAARIQERLEPQPARRCSRRRFCSRFCPSHCRAARCPERRVSRGQNRVSRVNVCSPFRGFHRVLAEGVADESPGLVTNSLRGGDLLLG